MFKSISDYYYHLLNNSYYAAALTIASICIGIAIIAWLVNLITKSYIIYIIRRVINKTNSNWAKTLIKFKVFQRLSHISPAVCIFLLIPFIETSLHKWTFKLVSIINTLTLIYIILVIVWFLMSLLDASAFYYKTKKSKSQPSINTYIQLIKIIIIAGSIILIISIILKQSPWIFFTGIGAISAVLMLVFKDTILGFVSSVQVSTFDMVRIGDWITVPSLSVDGDIMDISINTVKIRNFDKTITTIPTYALMSHGVQNWRGMQETGGRRIKRSINIDINTIKFCDQALIDTLSNLKYLKEHIANKSQEIEEHNSVNNCNRSLPIDGRSLTNIGLYQSYIENYLKNNSSISKELTFLIRQLQPDQYGIPIELYVFTNDTDWVKYEKIQSDIFDHLLAAVPMFELKVFQIISK